MNQREAAYSRTIDLTGDYLELSRYIYKDGTKGVMLAQSPGKGEFVVWDINSHDARNMYTHTGSYFTYWESHPGVSFAAAVKHYAEKISRDWSEEL